MKRARPGATSASAEPAGTRRLARLQATMFALVSEPLSATGYPRARTRRGEDVSALAATLVRPNDRLTSAERLGIYNEQYWLRVLGALDEDYPGLRALVGARRFRALCVAYLADCPSRSFTLRDLGARLPDWLARHRDLLDDNAVLAVDMARLEWAHVDAFDGLALPALDDADLAALDEHAGLHVQPHLQLLRLAFPVDDLLLAARHRRRRFAASALPAAARVHLAVYRVDGDVYFLRIEAAEYRLLRALQGGAAIGDAVERALRGRASDPDRAGARVREWFARASSLAWFGKAT